MDDNVEISYGRIRAKSRRFKRRVLLKRDGPICWLCLKELKPSEITLDHVIPRKSGGSNKTENLRLACLDCNGKRANKSLIETLLED